MRALFMHHASKYESGIIYRCNWARIFFCSLTKFFKPTKIFSRNISKEKISKRIFLVSKKNIKLVNRQLKKIMYAYIYM